MPLAREPLDGRRQEVAQWGKPVRQDDLTMGGRLGWQRQGLERRGRRALLVGRLVPDLTARGAWASAQPQEQVPGRAEEREQGPVEELEWALGLAWVLGPGPASGPAQEQAWALAPGGLRASCPFLSLCPLHPGSWR